MDQVALIVDRQFIRALDCKIDRTGELNLYAGRQYLIEQHLGVKTECISRCQKPDRVGIIDALGDRE